MLRVNKSSLFILIVALFFVACKKNNSVNPKDQSTDEIILSINNSSDVHYNKPSTNPVTEINGLYVVDFQRSYYLNNAYKSINEVNDITINIVTKNLSSQALPYSPGSFGIHMSTNIPSKLGTFSYTSALNNNKGHIALTVNSFKGQRIQGVFNGVVYSTYNVAPQPDSVSIKGSFNVLLPTYVNN